MRRQHLVFPHLDAPIHILRNIVIDKVSPFRLLLLNLDENILVRIAIVYNAYQFNCDFTMAFLVRAG